jgi:O-antigen/teichoic acid export membrane protein
VSSENRQHFATEHLLDDLKARALSGGLVTVGAQAAVFGLNLVGIVILARLLRPEDFGLVAMVTAVIGFVRIFKDAGLSTATVQREEITHAQVSNLFWINVAITGAIGLSLAAAAPLVARFYDEPRLIGITLALCVSFQVSGLTGQPMALLSRQMRFRAIAAIDILSILAGLVVAVAMSLLDYGYWSLVSMNLATVGVAFVLTWSASGWRPQLPRRHSGTSSLVSFGFNMTAASFIYSAARGIDSLLIGRLYGPDALGLYTRATALLARPLEHFIGPINAVFVPAFSRIQGQSVRYRRVFLLVYETLALAGSLFTGLLLGLADPLTLLVLGPTWKGAAPIFAGFAAVALFVPLCSACSWLMTSQGRGRDALLSSVIASGVTVIAFLAGIPYGPAGVAISYSIAGFVIQIPVSYYIAGRSGPVRTKDLWASTIPYVPVWITVAGVSWLTSVYLVRATPSLQLVVGGCAGLLCGALVIGSSIRARVVVLNVIEFLRQLRGFRGVLYGT